MPRYTFENDDDMFDSILGQKPVVRRSIGATGGWGEPEPVPSKPMSAPVRATRSPVSKPIESATEPKPVERIPEPVLQKLEAEKPELVARYRAKMAEADQGVKDAERDQKIGSYLNIAGKLANDYANSQKDDVIYKNSWSKMGNAPQIERAERKDYDPSMVDRMGQQGVDRAKANKSSAEDEFMTGEKLTDLQTSRDDQKRSRDEMLRLKDPNSAESIAARQVLQQMAPKFAAGKDFSNLSAAQIEKIAPQAFQASQQMASQEFQADENAKNRSAQAANTAAQREYTSTLKQNAAQVKRDVENDKTVERFSKTISGVQDTANAIAKVERKLGGSLDELEIKNGVLLRGGKPLDLPGVSIPLVGRVSAYDGAARELESAIGTVFNTELKDRSGAAVTNNEMERLKKEFGSGKFNSEAELIGALKDYKRAMQQELRDREAGFNPEIKEIYRERGGQTSEDFQVKPSEGKKPSWAK